MYSNKKKYDPELRYNAFRSNQFISPFGVGSIVDLPDESVMPATIDQWSDAGIPVLYDNRLQKRLKNLNITHFKKVPSKSEYVNGIPFYRFPKWLYCRNPKCGRLRHIEDWRKEYRKVKGKDSKIPRCSYCNLKLVPTRFIIICENGHIDDFPWMEWVHRGKSCPNPDLRLKTGGSNSGLGGIVVECKNCSTKPRSMSGAFNKDAHSKCNGRKPWEGNSSYESCDCTPITVQRTASNVYFPKTVSSILIPPYSNQLISDIQKTEAWTLLKTQSGLISDQSVVEYLYNTMANQLQKPVDEIKKAIEFINNGNSDESTNEIEYRYQEYMALLGNFDHEESTSKDFKIDIQKVDDYQIPGIESVVLVESLRELRALVSFSRITPLDRNDIGIGNSNQSNGVSIKSRDTRWLPAIEVRGEGIFITFKEEIINKWISENPTIRERADLINKRLEDSFNSRGMTDRKVSPKFILLHTLTHILIRELSFECGYATASLRERLYCNEFDNQPKMAGLLIYTASGDSEGTLGGLVRQGKPEFFNKIFKSAINRATWCSSDPLCIESHGQGTDALNLAACHACTLLPETSCEEFNRLLDRGLLIGTQTEDIGFFKEIMN